MSTNGQMDNGNMVPKLLLWVFCHSNEKSNRCESVVAWEKDQEGICKIRRKAPVSPP